MPRGKDLFKFSLGVWLSVLAAFELHSLFRIAQFLSSVRLGSFNSGVYKQLR